MNDPLTTVQMADAVCIVISRLLTQRQELIDVVRQAAAMCEQHDDGRDWAKGARAFLESLDTEWGGPIRRIPKHGRR